MSRPQYIRKSPMSEMITELIIMLIVIVMALYTLLTFSKLPKTVPTHIGVTGQVDGYVNKTMLLAMPIIGLVVCLGLSDQMPKTVCGAGFCHRIVHLHATGFRKANFLWHRNHHVPYGPDDHNADLLFVRMS